MPISIVKIWLLAQTYHDNVAIQILSHIDITLHDRVECGDVDSSALKTQDARLEESFWGAESLVANGDDLAIGQFVGLLQGGALAGSLNFLLEVERNVAELLLHVTDNFSLGGSREWVTTLSQALHQVIGKITASHVDT